jgi:DNA-binding MarR family transcriptional regulator
LGERGLVERRGDPQNLRVTHATITAEAREALERPAGVPRGGGEVLLHLGEEPLSDEPADARGDATQDARYELRSIE